MSSVERRRPSRFLSMRQVIERVSYSKTEVYRQIKDGLFPESFQLSAGRVAWLEHDVVVWQVDKLRAAGRSEDADDLEATLIEKTIERPHVTYQPVSNDLGDLLG